jgi:bifunctional DNA-binding transcriptional regulator/antitoxin component of YhaV-PrlF toxin-antitoxin module
MPKRWRIAAGSKYKVELLEVDRNDKVIEVLARTKLKWDKQQDADAVINEFRTAEVIYPSDVEPLA